MFEIGDLIIYGNTGVCVVEKIGRPDFSGACEDTDYYTLTPYYSSRSRIFTPCDNTKVVMRPVLSNDEATEILENMDSIGFINVPDEKQRESIYKETMKKCDCILFISILKTIKLRMEKRLSEGKKITANDEKYFNLAEDKLCGELAVALNKDKNDIRDFILSKINGNVSVG